MKTKKAISILVIIAVIGSVIVFLSLDKGPKVVYSTVRAEYGDLVQTVSETGTVKSEEEIDLNFLSSGNVAEIYFAVGDTVDQGDLLAELNYEDLRISRDEAVASLEVARQNLNKLLSGATDEEIAVARANAEQAKTAYEAAQKELAKVESSAAESIEQAKDAVNDLVSTGADNVVPAEQAVVTAQTNLDNAEATYQKAISDAVQSAVSTAGDKLAAGQTSLDAINRVLTDDDIEYLYSVEDPRFKSLAQSAYNSALADLPAAETVTTEAKASQEADDAAQALASVKDFLYLVFSALNYCFDGLENTITSSDFTLTELDAFKATISAELNTIASDITSIEAKEQALETAVLNYETKISEYGDALASARSTYNETLKSARNSLSNAELSGEQQIAAYQSKVDNARENWRVAEARLKQTLAPASQYDVSLYQAQVRQAEASLAAVENKIEKAKIFAPISGTVTKINVKAGEPALANGPAAITLLRDSNYEIEVLVSEADIAKVEVGDPAEITLDAYGEDVKFAGDVYFIEPAETEIQDVIYYKVKMQFDPGEYNIKSGMTANTVITTARKEKALLVPMRSVVEKNGSGKVIRVLENNEMKEKGVVMGLRGDGGVVEVLEGVSAGEEVITSIKEEDN